MKIVYKKPIFDQIRLALEEARKQGKEIDHIHLTTKERDELCKAIDIPVNFSGGTIIGLHIIVDGRDEIFGIRHDETEEEIEKIFKDVRESLFGVDAMKKKKV